jgi:hypothetical protein
VDVAPLSNLVEPGVETVINVKLTDSKQQPFHDGEVALMVVDESVLSTAAYKNPDLLKVILFLFFYCFIVSICNFHFFSRPSLFSHSFDCVYSQAFVGERFITTADVTACHSIRRLLDIERWDPVTKNIVEIQKEIERLNKQRESKLASKQPKKVWKRVKRKREMEEKYANLFLSFITSFFS